MKANPWLAGIAVPCRLRLFFGQSTADVTLTPFIGQDPPCQFKVGPTIGHVMRAWSGTRTISRERSLEVDGEILKSLPEHDDGAEDS